MSLFTPNTQSEVTPNFKTRSVWCRCQWSESALWLRCKSSTLSFPKTPVMKRLSTI